jgi:hypothetical protein
VQWCRMEQGSAPENRFRKAHAKISSKKLGSLTPISPPLVKRPDLLRPVGELRSRATASDNH